MQRLATVVAGYFLSVVAASVVLIGGVVHSGHNQHGPAAFADNSLLVLVLVIVLSSVPATLFILIAEYFSIRRWTYFALAGGAAPYLIFGALNLALGKSPFHLGFSLIFTSAGTAAGLVYWLIAGRRSGWGQGEA